MSKINDDGTLHGDVTVEVTVRVSAPTDPYTRTALAQSNETRLLPGTTSFMVDDEEGGMVATQVDQLVKRCLVRVITDLDERATLTRRAVAAHEADAVLAQEAGQ